ncbi:cytochrome P450 oxidoreductase [Fusarium oxysporum f. sp. conglutinans race 2 54008]|uniref:Choline monooxygenase, chloroplastic n=1 Tax=Fusarium oxysporum f. sp. conglutinans race 2 54008 TaxID=1089457 RepID=X0GUB1_FUSOX|nr:cytochrome P450 oxidoreductase [Fusarium oxysporum f. sp. conglutinans race 2 54008]
MQSTLPASWYREPGFYQLERRAIFSKSWILISHSCQFNETGKYVRYEMAGYPFFVIRDRAGNINAFLNICRHRAFPIVHKDSGQASVLSCKYHGWSYKMNGDLAKAPRFDSVPEFDKDSYKLYKVHTHIDKLGFVWVNLDAAETPTHSWEEQFGGVTEQPRLANYDLNNYKFDHTWSMEGKFNWKTLIENYNECYHCPTAHPGLAPFFKGIRQMVYGCQKHWIEHLGGKGEERSSSVSPTFAFPNASITLTPTLFYMMSIVPTSATTSLMRYEVYRAKDATDKAFREKLDFFAQVEGEDKWLANGAQGNLNSDTYTTGPFHPEVEEGVTFVTSLIKDVLHQHVDEEKKRGDEWWPARRALVKKTSEEDEVFCRGVCQNSTQNGNSAGEKLAW